MENAFQAVRNGMSQRVAAAAFNIPRRTLRNHLTSGSTEKCMGRKSVLTVEQEQSLVQRIKRFSDVGMPVTVSMLESYAYRFCEKINCNCIQQ